VRNIGKNPKGARAQEQDTAIRELSPPEDASEGHSKPSRNTREESAMGDSIRIKLPAGLRREIEEIVEYLGLWSNLTEFCRDAIRDKRDRWVEEARRVKAELEGGEARAIDRHHRARGEVGKGAG
jgi:Arc/MetJ-type ribon-helix-helix transcriptional regulator